MKTIIFNSKPYDKDYFKEVNRSFKHRLTFIRPRLSEETVSLAMGYDAVCVFVNDELTAKVIEELADFDIKLILLRCAGFNNVDIKAAEKFGITVARVPEYSPYGVAEHAATLVMGLNRKIYRAHNRIHEGNFSLNGLLGFELNGSTVGVIGTGRIGAAFAKIMLGFGCKVLAYDPHVNEELDRHEDVCYTTLNKLYKKSDIISLHIPLTPKTFHLINDDAISKMKKGVMIINTSRGALIETNAVVRGLKSGAVGYFGLDVYEEEAHFFFEDYSDRIIHDDTLARLMTFPNVLMTGHQAFFTKKALMNIATVTLQNVSDYKKGGITEECLVSQKLVS